MSKPQGKLKVWIAYQGKEAEDFVETITKESPPLHWEPVVTKSHTTSSAENQFRRVRNDCTTCDAAIAIIAEDPRPASSVGNLWFELGLWLGTRDPERLLICQKRGLTLPTDLGGTVPQEFDKPDELLTIATDFVLSLVQPSSAQASKPPGRKKIQAVLDNPKDEPWLEDDAYCCYRDEKTPRFCSFRENAVGFTAELLRMGRANHERHGIEGSLFNIAFVGKRLLLVIDKKDTEKKMEALTHLIDASKALNDNIERLFKTNGRKTYKVELTAEQRFTSFLKQKLQFAYDLAATDYGLRKWILWANPTEVESFQDWLKEVTSLNYQTRLKHEKGKSELTQRIIEKVKFCGCSAILLQTISGRYFEACREALAGTLPTAANPRLVDDAFKQAIKLLPHNCGTESILIWRPEEIEQ